MGENPRLSNLSALVLLRDSALLKKHRLTPTASLVLGEQCGSVADFLKKLRLRLFSKETSLRLVLRDFWGGSYLGGNDYSKNHAIR